MPPTSRPPPNPTRQINQFEALRILQARLADESQQLTRRVQALEEHQHDEGRERIELLSRVARLENQSEADRATITVDLVRITSGLARTAEDMQREREAAQRSSLTAAAQIAGLAEQQAKRDEATKTHRETVEAQLKELKSGYGLGKWLLAVVYFLAIVAAQSLVQLIKH